MPEFGTQTVEVRGISAFDQPAGLLVRFLALLIDGAWILALFYFVIRVFDLSPIPTLTILPLIIPIPILIWILQQIFFGGTLGQLLWRLRVLGPEKRRLRWKTLFKSRVYQHEKLSLPIVATATFLTIPLLAGSTWCVREALWKHSLFAQADSLELEPFFPQAADSTRWMVIPFFYALGAWPTQFLGQPVLYQFPYMKGPPNRFVENLIARWSPPEIQLTIEGPRTPGPREHSILLKSCLTQPWFQSLECLHHRELSIMRHIQEIRSIAPTDWTLRWFHVGHPALPESEQLQGIYLSAHNQFRAQDRFILITPQGTHQAFILNRPLSESGDTAYKTLVEAIRSQRISSQLAPGRAWVDQRLRSLTLEGIQKEKDQNKFLAEISETQALLLGKISVDPRTFDSYFHLGGTSLLLSQQAIKSKNPEWAAIAKATIYSTLRYAQDIDPKDSRTEQLRKIWQEIEKY